MEKSAGRNTIDNSRHHVKQQQWQWREFDCSGSICRFCVQCPTCDAPYSRVARECHIHTRVSNCTTSITVIDHRNHITITSFLEHCQLRRRSSLSCFACRPSALLQWISAIQQTSSHHQQSSLLDNTSLCAPTQLIWTESSAADGSASTTCIALCRHTARREASASRTGARRSSVLHHQHRCSSCQHAMASSRSSPPLRPLPRSVTMMDHRLQSWMTAVLQHVRLTRRPRAWYVLLTRSQQVKHVRKTYLQHLRLRPSLSFTRRPL